MKRTQDEAEKIFKDHGFILKDIYKNTSTPLFCIDMYGYKYAKRIGDVMNGKIGAPIHSKTPYVLDNIDLYIKLHNIATKRLSNFYIDSKTDMTWECTCGCSFDVSWNELQSGKYFCNFCAKSRRFDGYRDYDKEILDECNKRGYKLLTKHIRRATDCFEYICNKHKEFGIQKSTYDTMINCKKGCTYCGIESRGRKHRIREERLKELAESKGYIYAGFDYDNKLNDFKKVNIHIICPKHIEKGIQKVKYDNLKRNKGNCIYCRGQGRTKEDLQKELNNMHGTITLLNYIDYSSPILVRCNICGYEWETTGVNLTQGHRCPNCTKSTFELMAEKILINNGYRFIPQYRYDDCRDINPLPFDFYLPDYNILIEIDGEQHFMPINFSGKSNDIAEKNFEITQFHDTIKNEYCEKHNINLIRIPYWDKLNLEQVLLSKISSIIYKNTVNNE